MINILFEKAPSIEILEPSPLTLGSILITYQDESGVSGQVSNEYPIFIVFAINSILRGMNSFLLDTIRKQYVFVADGHDFEFALERKNNACLTLVYRGKRLGVFPEKEVLTSILNAVDVFQARYPECLHTLDTAFPHVSRDTMDEFQREYQRFRQYVMNHI